MANENRRYRFKVKVILESGCFNAILSVQHNSVYIDIKKRNTFKNLLFREIKCFLLGSSSLGIQKTYDSKNFVQTLEGEEIMNSIFMALRKFRDEERKLMQLKHKKNNRSRVLPLSIM